MTSPLNDYPAPTLREQLAAVEDYDTDDVEAGMPSEVYDTEPAAPARRQIGQLWSVIVEGCEEPLVVRSTNRDLIAWEKTKARHKEWPDREAAPIFATTFIVWAAARRAQQTALTFDQFADAVLDLDKVDEEPADPTR